MSFFLRRLFLGGLSLLFSLLASTIPPFQSAIAVGCVKMYELTSLTRFSNHHDFFVKLFSRMFEIIFTSSRAIFFF